MFINSIIRYLKRKKEMRDLRNRILYTDWKGKEQYDKELNFLKEKWCAEVYPYYFKNKYVNQLDLVASDDKGIFTYLDSNRMKKLYFPCGINEKKRVAIWYKNLRAEQDVESPHRYFTSEYYPNCTESFVDIGSAEGMEALEVVDMVNEIVLFEGEERWYETLKSTFEPYENKVRICNGYVGNTDETIRLDDFFSGRKGDAFFVKMDCEGSEHEVCNGAWNFFERNKIRLLITTYHRENDMYTLFDLLKQHNFQTMEYSDNYMLFTWDEKGLNPPFFRKGLIRARNY